MTTDMRRLRSPLTRQELSIASSEVLEALVPLSRLKGFSAVAITSDQAEAYPIVDGVPVLMAPEELLGQLKPAVDNVNANHAEAYEEMHHYNAVANAAAESSIRDTPDYLFLSGLLDNRRLIGSFPSRPWLDAKYDLVSQLDAYRALCDVEGLTVMQCGGRGLHALKFLVAGAREALLVTPMVGEARFARRLATELGLEDRLVPVVGVAEHLPVADVSIDRVFSGGSAHHFRLGPAMAEIWRVLNGGGRFAANDPYKAPLHKLGTRLLGKREPGVHCLPIDRQRLRELEDGFDGLTESRLSGVFFRYPLLAAFKAGFEPSYSRMHLISQIDDWLATATRTRRYGSSIAMMARKDEAQ